MAGGEVVGGGNPGAEPDNVEVIEIHHHYFHNRFGHTRAEECALDSCSLRSGSRHCDRRWLTCCFCSQGVFLKMLHWKEISSAHSVCCKIPTGRACIALLSWSTVHLIYFQDKNWFSQSLVSYRSLIFKWRKHTSSSTKFNDALKRLKS